MCSSDLKIWIARRDALLFQLVTLPVEFNASRRAIQILSEGGLLTEEEVRSEERRVGKECRSRWSP